MRRSYIFFESALGNRYLLSHINCEDGMMNFMTLLLRVTSRKLDQINCSCGPPHLWRGESGVIHLWYSVLELVLELNSAWSLFRCWKLVHFHTSSFISTPYHSVLPQSIIKISRTAFVTFTTTPGSLRDLSLVQSSSKCASQYFASRILSPR